MSVINQMLKDLDQRQVEQQGSSNFIAPVTEPTSNKKTIIISIIIIVLLNIAGIFVWQIYEENQELKMSKTSKVNETTQQKLPNKPMVTDDAEQDNLNAKLTNTPNTITHENSKASDSAAINDRLNQTPLAQPLTNTMPNNEGPGEHIVTTKKMSANLPNQVKKAIAPTPVTRPYSAAGKLNKNENQQQEPVVPTTKKSTLTISRKQLTPHELAKKNLQRAEQALENKDISKAESLFEEVLLVMPEHKSARKQLAALWFGRQSYKDALNLISQGIDLAPNDSEFRVMKARIYLQENKIPQAFYTLNNMPGVNDVFSIEHQSLRATTAQQVKEYSVAAQAYKMLVKIEPTSGRWWLGLAVALDSNSEFKQASVAYQTALNQSGLSASAETFARQRIIELGE